MLPANAPVLAALALPAVMVVSERRGDRHRRAGRASSPTQVLGERLLVQVREKALDRQKRAAPAVARAHARRALRRARRREQRLRELPAGRRRAPHRRGADGRRERARRARSSAPRATTTREIAQRRASSASTTWSWDR